MVRSLRATAAAALAESSTTPVLVLCSGKLFITFTSAAAAECNSAADINALSTHDDDDDSKGREWEFPSDDVMLPYDVSGDSMTSQRDMRPDVGGKSW